MMSWRNSFAAISAYVATTLAAGPAFAASSFFLSFFSFGGGALI